MAEKKGYTLNSWARIRLLAKDPQKVFNNLFHHINDENLRQAFRALDGSKAVGIDNVTKKQYADNLDENLRDLKDRLHSVMSPVLANIYLHHVLDKWFKANHASKDAAMVRYADDAVFMFSQEETAKAFLVELETRLTKYGLALNSDKTGIINFKKGKEQVLHFLGFTFYWNHKKGWNKINLVIKTQTDRLFKKVSEYTDWIKINRARHSTKEIWEITAAKLRGHYNYFGYYCNRSKLMHFYTAVTQSLFKWLNRRSQRKSFSWKQFVDKLKANPLPRPPGPTQLKQLGWSPYVK